jgi:hypothetical protein
VGAIRSGLRGLAVILSGSGSAIWKLAGLLHIGTVILAFLQDGFLAALLTFFLTGFSVIYWLIQIIRETGVFWNSYTIAVGIWLLLYLLQPICRILVTRLRLDD